MSTRSAHSSEDRCIPADLLENDFLIADPAEEVSERGTRDRNDGNKLMNIHDLPLNLELNERRDVDNETFLYAEEEQIEAE